MAEFNVILIGLGLESRQESRYTTPSCSAEPSSLGSEFLEAGWRGLCSLGTGVPLCV